MRGHPTNAYSRYVSLMKIILPAGILFSIGLALGWPYFISIGKESLSKIDLSRPEIQENRMVHPHYISTDNQGQPFHLTAEWAKQKTEDLADLIQPEGSMTMLEGETFKVNSKKGHYDTQGKILILQENVTLTSTDGYLIKTEKARINIDKKIIEGDDFIEGSGPTGAIMGTNGFKVENHPHGKKVITLKGVSRVILTNVSRKKDKKSHEN
ncbi:MAG: LPS export ABC transporter periplasmic protein LptC [Alphaproteobacteria bacterium]|nr:LPS export ABC transporter periplasmic protein LptC [Alphaproteobacteria bacterium]